MATISDVTNILRSGDTYVDSVLGNGPAWNYLTPSTQNFIYYTFSNDGDHTSTVSDVTTFNSQQKSAAREAMTYTESVTGIHFVETSLSSQAHLAFLGGNISGANVTGLTSWESNYSYTANNIISTFTVEVELFLDIYDFSSNLNPASGTNGYETLLHEIGHVLGLKHPFEGTPQLPVNLDNTSHTLMSYTEVGTPKSSFQEYDLAALWWIYGGDGLRGTYGINSNTGPTLTPPNSDMIAPTVSTFTPPNDANGVGITENIVVTFSENIQRGTGNIAIKTFDGLTIATYNASTSNNLSIAGNVLTINPSDNLNYGTHFSVEFVAGSIKDLAGNSFTGTTSYNFTTMGDPSNQTLIGTNLNETFTGGTGNDSIDGGGGIDTASYALEMGNYSIYRSAPGYTVTANAGTDGTDTLTNIERLQFSNKKIALDLTPDGNAGKSLEFIGMLAHNFVNNPVVVGNILSIFDQGKSMKEICQLAIDVELTRDLAGSNSNQDLAKLVFRNVTGNEASAAATDYLAGYIQGSGGSMSQAEFLVAVAQLEANNQHINLVGLQSTGVEYII